MVPVATPAERPGAGAAVVASAAVVPAALVSPMGHGPYLVRAFSARVSPRTSPLVANAAGPLGWLGTDGIAAPDHVPSDVVRFSALDRPLGHYRLAAGSTGVFTPRT